MRLLALLVVLSFSASAEDWKKLDETPEGKAWSAIWKSKDSLKALKAFQKKYGLPLVTTEKVGRLELPAVEAPCTGTYLSLVKDARKLSGTYLEVKPDGRVLSTWHSGSDNILGILKNTLARKVSFYESLSDYSMTKPQPTQPKTHDYVLRIENLNAIYIYPGDTADRHVWKTEDVECPAKHKSDLTHCVKSDEGRIFVLPYACS